MSTSSSPTTRDSGLSNIELRKSLGSSQNMAHLLKNLGGKSFQPKLIDDDGNDIIEPIKESEEALASAIEPATTAAKAATPSDTSAKPTTTSSATSAMLTKEWHFSLSAL